MLWTSYVTAGSEGQGLVLSRKSTVHIKVGFLRTLNSFRESLLANCGLGQWLKTRGKSDLKTSLLSCMTQDSIV